MRLLRHHATYANVMATIAVFVALGGTSYAALRVGGENIQRNAVTGAHIRNGSVTRADLHRSARPGTTVGARGPQGPAGDQGPKGEAGPAGIAGPAGSPDTPAQVLAKLDANETIELTSPNGSFSLRLSDAGVRMSGPGGSVEVTPTKVSADGNVVEVGATNNLRLSSSAAASLTASGPTRIGGALVLLNCGTSGSGRPLILGAAGQTIATVNGPGPAVAVSDAVSLTTAAC